MKNSLILLLLLLLGSLRVNAGTLYSVDYNEVLFSALGHIKLRHSDLGKMELKPRPLRPNFDNNGKLFITATFSYKADNELGVLFVCVKVDENGNLVDIDRDIKPKEGIAKIPMPEYPGCW